MPNTIYQTDGSMDFSRGVDSGKVPLLQSSSNPNGLRRDQLAWMTNCTVRGGAIQQRAGWKHLLDTGAVFLFQGAYLYEPPGASATPYFIASIAGRIYRIDPVSLAVTDLSAIFALTNPPAVEQAYFAQGEEFLVIQAGDGVTNPLFWDGATLRRSNGFLGVGNPGNEIPAALSMDYYMQRIWYSQNRLVSAGDIVKGPSGTAPYDFRDSILKVTENPLAIGGDGFSVPINSGPIRAVAHAAAIDVTLGQGQLFVFTRKDIWAISVPITRADWTSTTEPLQRVIQKKWGTVADRSIVSVNGDLYYQTMEPGIRSLALAVRFFQQWGNTPISRNMARVLNLTNRGLARFNSGMLFDNRLWQTELPVQTPIGVAGQCAAILDFDLISSFQDKLEGAQIPSWEGIWEGLDILQLASGDFGGLERAFAFVYSSGGQKIQLWELTSADKAENGDNRVKWWFETPSFPFKDIFEMKTLAAGDLWVDRISGKVDITVEYRADDDPCWHFWAQFSKCYARTSCEDLVNPVCYPVTPYGEGYDKPLTLPDPNPNGKGCMSNRKRPANVGHCFQVKITVKGFCRFRGFLLYAAPLLRGTYEGIVC